MPAKMYSGFFNQPVITLLKASDDGYEKLYILLRLYVLSDRNGKLMISKDEPYDIESLASVIDRHTTKIEETISLCNKYGLIETEDGVYRMSKNDFVDYGR